MPLDTIAQLYGYSAMWITAVVLLLFVAACLWGRKMGLSAGARRGVMLVTGVVGIVGMLPKLPVF